MNAQLEKMTFDELKSFRQHNFVHGDILNQKKLWGKVASGVLTINADRLEVMVKRRVEIEKNMETLSFLNYGKLQGGQSKPRNKKKSTSVHPLERKDTRTFSEVLFPRQSNPERSVMTNFKPVRSSSNDRQPFVLLRAKIHLTC